MKGFKDFIVLLGKIILAGAPLIGLWLFCIFGKMYYMDGEAPYYLWIKEQINTPHDNVEVLFMGDSSMNSAVDPTLIPGEKSLSIANGGGCPYDGYYLLKEYLEHNPAPKVLYYGYEYEHVAGGGSLWDRVYYTQLISYKDAIELIDELNNHGLSWVFQDHNAKKDIRAYYANYPGEYLPAMINARFVGRYKSNQVSWDTIEAHQGHYIALTDEINPDYEVYTVYGFTVADACDYYIHKTMELCQEYGIQVRMIGLPSCPNTTFDKEFQEAEYSYMSGVADSYDNVTYLPIISMEHKYFLDGHHMNNSGCAFFTDFLTKTYPEDFAD